jgi:hypothetical protein
MICDVDANAEKEVAAPVNARHLVTVDGLFITAV